ncbi:[acyl-carrier-protein] S-malonyltransferase [Aliidiomarina taiwanensis]|uniref:Malonyl CoA-acyl carrier protein transacylase n=1 Tax=Aliidiomarina taiwanensis TaxID=946228 RepID=A0A432X9R1_9GAMM|nr:ACP S-malonyltransferase [Aliidiomarina taiwanensis]RUO44050.1 [acyl-carrier-protein] S-malonyltransferase [Aliidiomarina taiwanensis]
MAKYACVFPGQGSQSVGMVADLYADYPQVRETFQEASDALGYDLWDVIENNPDGRLNQTEVTQPAILAASVAIYRVLSAQPDFVAPSVMAGHSLGEYSALVCAGAIDFVDAVRLVALRGQAMQAAVPEGTGAMAAIIGLDDAAVAAACEESAQGEIVAPVNYNSPGQVVIAGHKAAVERAGEACKAAGAKRALPLPVSVPSHCALMQPAAEKLAEALQTMEVRVPSIPVIHNVSVALAESDEAIQNALVAQLYSPVRWTETVQHIASLGITELYEVGPGKVLSGLTKRIDKSLVGQSLNSVASVQAFHQ